MYVILQNRSNKRENCNIAGNFKARNKEIWHEGSKGSTEERGSRGFATESRLYYGRNRLQKLQISCLIGVGYNVIC